MFVWPGRGTKVRLTNTKLQGKRAHCGDSVTDIVNVINFDEERMNDACIKQLLFK